MVWYKAYFDILNPLGVTQQPDREKDAQTDGHTFSYKCNAAHYYVVRSKTC